MRGSNSFCTVHLKVGLHLHVNPAQQCVFGICRAAAAASRKAPDLSPFGSSSCRKKVLGFPSLSSPRVVVGMEGRGNGDKEALFSSSLLPFHHLSPGERTETPPAEKERNTTPLACTANSRIFT